MRHCRTGFLPIHLVVSIIKESTMSNGLPFPSYKEILEVEAHRLADTIPIESGSSRIGDSLDEKVQSYAEGELPHASEALLSLIDALCVDSKNSGVEVTKSVRRNLCSLLSVVIIQLVQRKTVLRLIGLL
jgi:hypothetical protein